MRRHCFKGLTEQSSEDNERIVSIFKIVNSSTVEMGVILKCLKLCMSKNT